MKDMPTARPRHVTTLIPCFVLVAGAAVATGARGAENESGYALPRTCDEAVELILARLDEASATAIVATPTNELDRFQRTWGRGIIDGFELANGNDALMTSCVDGEAGMARHPVAVASTIMRRVRERLAEREEADAQPAEQP